MKMMRSVYEIEMKMSVSYFKRFFFIVLQDFSHFFLISNLQNGSPAA